jgi:hypothetical protein
VYTDADTYLTEAEIRHLTKRKYAKAQCKVLADRGWAFEVDGNGYPVVLRAFHDQKLGLKEPSKRRRPRLSGLSA